MVIHTIGHSTRARGGVVALLRREGIRQLADVRSYPSSRRHPQFNREPFARALADVGIAYSSHLALGGRRTAHRDSRNTGWRNVGFRGYADYMESDEFAAGLEALLSLAADAPTAIMCAEAVPWRCHRSLIADALTVRGVEVRHILDAATRPHVLTSFAVVHDGRVSYPGPSIAQQPEQPGLFDAPGRGEV